MLRPYHARFRAEIERLGGTLDKFIGDGVMAVFGAPVAHEDDPERAVRCGLGMLDAIDELNEARPELDLAIRIGINTGEALVPLGAGAETGRRGHRGRGQHRLPAAGGRPGRRRGGRGGDLPGDPAALRLRGARPRSRSRARPTRCRCGGAGRPQPRRGRRRSGAPSTPFIGRERELDLLLGTFERTVSDRDPAGHGRGEPGVGKSRLVSELAAYVDDRPELVVWRQGRCLPYGDGITFWALGEIVKAQAGILESDPPTRSPAKLDTAVADLRRRRSRSATGCGPGSARCSGSAGRRRGHGRRGTSCSPPGGGSWRRSPPQRPLVLVVEDLHWADPALLEFLEHLADWADRRCPC